MVIYLEYHWYIPSFRGNTHCRVGTIGWNGDLSLSYDFEKSPRCWKIPKILKNPQVLRSPNLRNSRSTHPIPTYGLNMGYHCEEFIGIRWIEPFCGLVSINIVSSRLSERNNVLTGYNSDNYCVFKRPCFLVLDTAYGTRNAINQKIIMVNSIPGCQRVSRGQ